MCVFCLSEVFYITWLSNSEQHYEYWATTVSGKQIACIYTVFYNYAIIPYSADSSTPALFLFFCGIICTVDISIHFSFWAFLYSLDILTIEYLSIILPNNVYTQYKYLPLKILPRAYETIYLCNIPPMLFGDFVNMTELHLVYTISPHHQTQCLLLGIDWYLMLSVLQHNNNSYHKCDIHRMLYT